MGDLNSKLSGYRDEEVEIRSRLATLASDAEDRDLNSDEVSEIGEKETRLGEVTEQVRAIERLLKIGDFHKDRNDSEGMNDNEKREFSFLRLIRALDPKSNQADKNAAGFELEMSAEVTNRIGREPRGAWIPNDVMGEWDNRSRKARQTRDLSANDFDQAAALVGVDFRPQAMIELLRNNMACTAAGVTYLDGLVGDVAIPKQTGGGTASWVSSDGGAISETNQTVGQVTLTPRTLGCFTDYTRQLRLQSSVSVEQFIRNDLSAIIGLEIDRAAIHGTGSSGQPTGVENVTGIGSESFSTASTPTRSEVVAMRSDLATANALLGSLAFITGVAVYGNMMDTVIDAGSGRFLIDESGTLIGRPAIESTQITAGQMYFGNWSDLLIGSWGGFDLLVDPYTGATAGTVRILVFQSIDVAVRHAESFTLGS